MLRRFFDSIFKRFIAPRSRGEDDRRHEFLLNVLLFGSLLLSGLSSFMVLMNRIREGDAHQGDSPLIGFTIFLLFLSLYLLSRSKKFLTASYILVSIYFLAITYTAATSGVENPHALLLFSLVISMAGILISARFAVVITVLTAVVLIGGASLQHAGVLEPKLFWKVESIRPEDGIAFASVLGIIMLLSWLSNREIERSLARARRSESALRQERDQLEVRVEERTRELKEVQIEKLSQLYRFAEFGRSASGYMHDLVNPLTAVSLNLEQLSQDDAATTTLQENITHALDGTKRMERFLDGIRRTLATQETKESFSVVQSIEEVVQIISHRALKKQIQIRLEYDRDVQTYGNALKFEQVIMNLLSNAIDAYADSASGDTGRDIVVHVARRDGEIHVSVQDWGIGISENGQKRIFEPLYTTKPVADGTGLGLSLSREIIEKNFSGTLACASVLGEGSTFSITFPHVNESTSV